MDQVGEGSVKLNNEVPERELFSAVILRALTDLVSNDPYVKRKAVEWIFSENEGEQSIYWYMRALGYEPEFVWTLRARVICYAV